MKTHRWKDIKNRKGRLSNAEVDSIEAEAEAQAITFRTLREEAGLSQAQVANLASVTQSEVSRFEQRDDHRLSQMRKMVEAVGGELKVIAVVNGKELRIA